MKHQRVAAGALDCHHFADEYYVIAGGMPRVMAAFEPRDAAIDQWRIRPPKPVRDTRESVRVRTRKATRKIGLLG